MRAQLIVVLAALTVPVSAPAQPKPKPADAIRKEQEKLRGCWKAIDGSFDGKQLTPG